MTLPREGTLRRGSPYAKPEAWLDDLCAHLERGEPMAEFCRQPKRPTVGTIYTAQENDKAIADKIARARKIGFDVIANQCLVIANSTHEGIETEEDADGNILKIKRGDMLGHRKLQIETRLKLLAKWDPRRYGEMTRTEVTGAEGGPVEVKESPLNIARQVGFLLAAGLKQAESAADDPDK